MTVRCAMCLGGALGDGGIGAGLKVARWGSAVHLKLLESDERAGAACASVLQEKQMEVREILVQ